MAGLFLSAAIQSLPTILGPHTSSITQMERRLPKRHSRTDAYIDALLDTVLRHLDDLIACGKDLIRNPSDLVTEHNGPTLGV